MDLQAYEAYHIASFLLNYALLVRDLAEVPANWPNLDDEERGYHRAELLQTWGNRQVLGHLFKARRLQPAEEARLADLDRQLFGQAMRMEQCFDLDLHQLLAIFRWAHASLSTLSFRDVSMRPLFPLVARYALWLYASRNSGCLRLRWFLLCHRFVEQCVQRGYEPCFAPYIGIPAAAPRTLTYSHVSLPRPL